MYHPHYISKYAVVFSYKICSKCICSWQISNKQKLRNVVSVFHSNLTFYPNRKLLQKPNRSQNRSKIIEY